MAMMHTEINVMVNPTMMELNISNRRTAKVPATSKFRKSHLHAIA
jgi:hypothetical protein